MTSVLNPAAPAFIADLSGREKIRVSGKDRTNVLHRLLTQEIRPLKPGDWILSSLLNARGKVLSVMNVMAFEDFYWLDVDAGCAEKTMASLNRLIITEDAVLTQETGLCHFLLAGSSAAGVLEKVFQNSIPEPAPFHYTKVQFQAQSFFLLCKSPQIFEIIFPASLEKSFRERVLEAGAVDADSSTYETFRIEHGIFRYGQDITEEVTLPETGLDAAASSGTKGCYPGQEVVARTNTYKGHTKKMRGLILECGQVPVPGTKLFSDEAEAGWITSAGFSPVRGKVLALAYLNKGFFDAPRETEFIIKGVKTGTRVVELPFPEPL